MVMRIRKIIYLLPLFLTLPGTAIAHSPHHVITDVAASPADATGSDVYILITDQIFKSELGGAAWKNLEAGLNNQYSFTSLGISPNYSNDRTLFVSSGGDGVYTSSDAGATWQQSNRGLGSLNIQILSLSKNFANDSRILAAAGRGGLWRRDSADIWKMVLTENVRITSFAEQASDTGNITIYAADSTGRVWRSTDNGRLWEIAFQLENDTAITSIAVDADTVFVGTSEYGLYRSEDAAASFARVDTLMSERAQDCRGNPLPQIQTDDHVTSVSFGMTANREQRVLVTTWYNGVFASDDNGDTWSVWRDGLSCDQQADDMNVSHYVGITTANNGDAPSDYWLASFNGLFKSADIGKRWDRLETLPLGLIKGMVVSGGDESPLTIALATYGGGFYLTSNRGESWTIGNKGLQTTRLTGLSFSPNYAEDGVIFAGASRRLLRSADRGSSWSRINLQQPSLGTRIVNKFNRWGISTNWLRSPSSSGTRQVYPTIIAQSPSAAGKRVMFATRFHGVMGYDFARDEVVSLWSETDDIMNSFEMSREFDSDGTLFASIRNAGAIRSDDGGIHWQAVNSGLDFVDRWSANSGEGDFRRDVLLAMSPNFGADHTVFAGSPAGDGLYRSSDRGNSWSRVALEGVTNTSPVLAIALSPSFGVDGTMFVSIKGHGLLKSTDGGRSFSGGGPKLLESNASIEWLELSEGYSRDLTVVAASDEQLFLSENGGENWSQIPRPVRYEDMRDVIFYTGNWSRQNGEEFSAMSQSSTSEGGATARLNFVGSGIRWIGSCSSDAGSAAVYIDSRLVKQINCSEFRSEPMQTLFETSDLESGAHTIEVHIAAHDPDLTTGHIAIDAFDVLPALTAKN